MKNKQLEEFLINIVLIIVIIVFLCLLIPDTDPEVQGSMGQVIPQKEMKSLMAYHGINFVAKNIDGVWVFEREGQVVRLVNE